MNDLLLWSLQMDLLRDKAPDVGGRSWPEEELDGGRSSTDPSSHEWDGWSRTGEGEEKVVSLRLLGMGVQLHSKSYGARFSFSLQDVDLEVTRRGLPY